MKPGKGVSEKASKPVAPWELILYVAGMNVVAQRARDHLEAILQAHVVDGYRLQIVDLLQEPGRAESDQILAIPTLIRISPQPVRKVIGDLSNTARVLIGLGIHPPVASQTH